MAAGRGTVVDDRDGWEDPKNLNNREPCYGTKETVWQAIFGRRASKNLRGNRVRIRRPAGCNLHCVTCPWG